MSNSVKVFVLLSCLMVWETAAAESHWPGLEVDWSRTGILQGTGQGFWNGKLWGINPQTYRVWSYDGQRITLGGRLPEGYTVIGLAWYTSAGMIVPLYHAPTNSTHLVKSEDGYQDFRIVNTRAVGWNQGPRQSSLHRSLVDLGQGRLLYADYVGRCKLHYSEDGGESWRILINLEDMQGKWYGGLHFHGVHYDPAYGKLYLMTGDRNPNASILVCDDLYGPDGLINNPDLWRQRWGLNDADRSTLDPHYALRGVDGQLCTQLNIAVDMHTVGDYVYWGQDHSTATGTRIFRANRESGVVEEVALGQHVVGQVWHWMSTEEEVTLFLTVSLGYGQYETNHDEYLRVYALSEDGLSVQELLRVRRKDWKIPIGLCKWWGYTEAFGYLWLSADDRLDGIDGILAARLVVPEPGSNGYLLAGAGVGGGVGWRRRRR